LILYSRGESVSTEAFLARVITFTFISTAVMI
jgi:hypothetical protein